MKYILYICFGSLLFASCNNNLEDDTNFDYYFTVENFGNIDDVEIQFEFARIHASNIGESNEFIHTVSLNPVRMNFDPNDEMNNLHYLGDSGMWDMDVKGVDVYLNGGGIIIGGNVFPVQKSLNSLIVSPFDLQIREGDAKSILFTLDLQDALKNIDDEYYLENEIHVSILE